MSLAASDIASLANSLSRWETAEYICAGLVTLACASEAVADFTDWLTNGIKERKDRLTKASTLLLIAALAFELICLVQTNTLSGRMIGSLNDIAREARDNAKTAREDSGIAVAQSQRANSSASDALGLARGARGEADSFEKDIVSAKEQAASAESHLADALQRAANAEKETARLTETVGGWNLTPEAQKRIAVKLKPFSGSPFELYVNPAEVSFMEMLDALLTSPSVGWVRQTPKPPGGQLGIFLVDNKASILLVPGITVEFAQESVKKFEPAANALLQALKDEGISAAGHEVMAGANPATIQIIIGKRQ